MLTIIIGIILSIIITVIWSDHSNDINAPSLFCSIGFIFSILLGLFYPFSGYNNWKLVKETFKCQEPILMEYKRTAKKSIWTFGLLSNETSYVFNVPEGTISKDITLR